MLRGPNMALASRQLRHNRLPDRCPRSLPDGRLAAIGLQVAGYRDRRSPIGTGDNRIGILRITRNWLVFQQLGKDVVGVLLGVRSGPVFAAFLSRSNGHRCDADQEAAGDSTKKSVGHPSTLFQTDGYSLGPNLSIQLFGKA